MLERIESEGRDGREEADTGWGAGRVEKGQNKKERWFLVNISHIRLSSVYIIGFFLLASVFRLRRPDDSFDRCSFSSAIEANPVTSAFIFTAVAAYTPRLCR